MLRALRYRNYRLFFAGQIVSLIGTWITNIATSWLVYRLTGSALLLGIVGFSGQLPAFLLSPFAGLVVDRRNKHKILIVTQTLSMLQSFALAVLMFGHWVTIPWLLVLSALQGLVNAFDMPCRHAFVVEMIEKREDLGNAIALNSSMFNAARLVGPAIGGVLIAAVGEGWCFFADGVSYLAVIAALLAMKLRVREPFKRTGASTLSQLKEGLKYVLKSKPIRSLLILIALASFMGVPYMVLMPVFAGAILGGGPHTLGFLMTAAGGGALIGALWLASRRSVLGLGRIIAFATVAFGIGLIAFSFSRSLVPALVFLVLAGLGFMIQSASTNTILQTIVEDDKRGRVMSLFIMAFIGTAPFGSLLAGSLSQKIGVPHTLLLSGLCCLGGALWFYRQLPEIREAIRPIYITLGIIPEVQTGIETVSELSLPPEE
jgi:MFS family permease